jgi:ankyrin repeat protein
LLLANKADVNAKNNEGWTPLHEAVACEKNGCKDVVKLLRQHGGRE